MTNPATYVVNALVMDKWFQMLLTLVVIVGYLVLIVTQNPDGAETFKNFSLIAFGYWFGQLGSGIAIAQKVSAERVG